MLASSVKIEGEACNRIQEGSGFVVDTDLVVTNAHVIAGESETTVIRSDGSRVDAEAVAFDPNRDLAVLRVPGLDRPGLQIVDGDPGDRGGVYGYPRGGPLRISPYQLGQEVNATGTDIYDQRRTQRGCTSWLPTWPRGLGCSAREPRRRRGGGCIRHRPGS